MSTYQLFKNKEKSYFFAGGAVSDITKIKEFQVQVMKFRTFCFNLFEFKKLIYTYYIQKICIKTLCKKDHKVNIYDATGNMTSLAIHNHNVIYMYVLIIDLCYIM